MDTNELEIRSSKLQLNQQDNGNCASAIQQGAHIFLTQMPSSVESGNHVWNVESLASNHIGQSGQLSRAGPLPDDSQHFFESMMIFLRAPMGGRWRCMYRFPERQKPLPSDDGWLRFLSPQNEPPINLKMNQPSDGWPNFRGRSNNPSSFFGVENPKNPPCRWVDESFRRS